MAATVDALVDKKGFKDCSDIFNVAQCAEDATTDEQANGLAKWYSDLSPERQESWYMAAGRLHLYRDRAAGAKTAKALIDVRLEEAVKLFWPLFKIDIPIGQDAAPRRAFNHWLRHFAIVGYGADTIIDMRRDNETGDIQVAPTLSNKVEILRVIKPHVMPCLRVGRVALKELLWSGLFATVKERNR